MKREDTKLHWGMRDSNDFEEFEDTNSDSSNSSSGSVERLKGLRTLVLNADFQPLSYSPLSVVRIEKIFFWIAKGESRGHPIVTVLDEYDETIKTVRGELQIPAVVAMTRQVPHPKRVPFSRRSIFIRDQFQCQYTGIRYPASELNLDHVLPASRGGKTSWENIVTCHISVNSQKRDRTPKEAGLRLIRSPYEPTYFEMREKGKNYPPRDLHKSWMDYLYFNAEID
jgi:5-methylcytosine-specific restriction endonuclease McrA